MRSKCFFIILVVLFLMGSIDTLFALGIGLKGSLGYGLPIQTRLRGQSYTEFWIDDDYRYDFGKSCYDAFGEGIKLNGSFQIMLSSSGYIELSGSYSHMLSKLEYEHNYPEDDRTYLYQYQIGTLDYLSFNFGLGAKMFSTGITPFCGFGLGINLPIGTVKFTNNYTRDYSDYTREDIYNNREYEWSFNPSIGYYGYIGLELPIMKFVSFFVETKITTLAFQIKEEKIVKANYNGIDELDRYDLDPNEPGNQQSLIYKKNSSNSPAPWLIEAHNLQLQVGMILHFSQ